MKSVGIIGLGDIALKAYLPILAARDLNLHLCTRDKVKLHEVSRQYRISNTHSNIESLLDSGIEAAFVHTATPAHGDIVEALLEKNIHVFVDKPLTSDFESSKRLIRLAHRKQLILTVGFNRRFAPAYAELKQLPNPNMILMQKNRVHLPGPLRTFVFDDFIHVVDTLLFLFPYPIARTAISGKRSGDLLQHVVVQFFSDKGDMAMGIMNRDAGVTEERLEVFTNLEKKVVFNLTERYTQSQNLTKQTAFNDWETTLAKRGFVSMIDSFLAAVSNGTFAESNALLTHQVCEEIVRKLEEDLF